MISLLNSKQDYCIIVFCDILKGALTKRKSSHFPKCESEIMLIIL